MTRFLAIAYWSEKSTSNYQNQPPTTGSHIVTALSFGHTITIEHDTSGSAFWRAPRLIRCPDRHDRPGAAVTQSTPTIVEDDAIDTARDARPAHVAAFFESRPAFVRRQAAMSIAL